MSRNCRQQMSSLHLLHSSLMCLIWNISFQMIIKMKGQIRWPSTGNIQENMTYQCQAANHFGQQLVTRSYQTFYIGLHNHRKGLSYLFVSLCPFPLWKKDISDCNWDNWCKYEAHSDHFADARYLPKQEEAKQLKKAPFRLKLKL